MRCSCCFCLAALGWPATYSCLISRSLTLCQTSCLCQKCSKYNWHYHHSCLFLLKPFQKLKRTSEPSVPKTCISLWKPMAWSQMELSSWNQEDFEAFVLETLLLLVQDILKTFIYKCLPTTNYWHLISYLPDLYNSHLQLSICCMALTHFWSSPATVYQSSLFAPSILISAPGEKHGFC